MTPAEPEPTPTAAATPAADAAAADADAAGPVLRTARLTLRRPTPADLDGLATMNADPEVMRYIGTGNTRTREQTRSSLERAATDWNEKGYGLFSIDLRADRDGPVPADTFVGWVTLAEPLFVPQLLPAVEIGWRLLRPHWGHGYATEAARATMRFAFVVRGLDHLVSIRHPDNHASRRVMEKLGLRHARETTVPASGQPVVVHTIARREYEAADRTAPSTATPPTSAGVGRPIK
jgi:RimJ/RimL family protein N-acetyltransferase